MFWKKIKLNLVNGTSTKVRTIVERMRSIDVQGTYLNETFIQTSPVIIQIRVLDWTNNDKPLP